MTIGQGPSLYIFEMGAGEPTVLFEAGIGATQPQLATHSGDGRPIQLTPSLTIAAAWAGAAAAAPPAPPATLPSELHQTADRAGLKPPFILVGHSFGGLVMRRYALLYPDEVAGVVLIDPMRCDRMAAA